MRKPHYRKSYIIENQPFLQPAFTRRKRFKQRWAGILRMKRT